ncbi:MAG TPA: RES family NAD+ phosphorylase [Gemmatimonadaceae bacterium]|jgi:hypothetical protein
MLSSIWTQCAGDSSLRPLRVDAWRVVEAQHQVSTRKLVDTADEQVLLEELIDGVKPPDPTHGTLHYLLATPFRYPPLPHGSRFGARHQPSVWYGSETLETALAEVAYYRLVFLAGTSASFETLTTTLTAFTARASSTRGTDLVSAPFDVHRETIASPAQYTDTQQLGNAMRAAGVELFRYPSARAQDGVNIGAFVPSVFGRGKPRAFETWHCVAKRSGVELAKRDYFARGSVTFPREHFLIDGSLPAPAL